VPLAAQGLGFPEADAAIRTLLLQYDPDIAGDVFPTWRDLAAALPTEVRIVVAAGADEQRAARRLVGHAGIADARLELVAVEGRPTVWARDRLVALGSNEGTALTTPDPASLEFDLRPDISVAGAIEERLAGFRTLPTRFRFAGGDLLFSSRRAIAGAELLFANLEHPDQDPGPLLADLHAVFGTDPLLIGRALGAPHPHCDMYLTVAGPRTVLLGDPRLGADLLDELQAGGLPASVMPLHDEWLAGTARAEAPRYDSIRDELRADGFEVLRLPILVGQQGSFLTWNNALVERREDGRRAYVPVYGLPALDERALAVYAAAGLHPRPIDVARLAPHGGTVRCVTNVLEWRAVAATESLPR
jgi:hypothetical protein